MTNDLALVLISAVAAVVTMLIGVTVGWRCRSGQSPVPPLPSFRKPEQPKKPDPPKPQVTV